MSFLKTFAWGVVTVAAAAYGITAVSDIIEDHHIQVHNIVDGDTIDVIKGDEVTRVRLLNIDTPELSHEGRPAECLAEEAKEFLANLIPVGTEITLEYDEERPDKYGRTLAGVFKDDSLVNAQVAAEGLAVPIVIEPNRRFYDEVAAAAATAKSASKGISTLGPECTVSDPAVAEDLQQSTDDIDKARASFPISFSDDDDFDSARRTIQALTTTIGKLETLSKKNIDQSDFQKAAYGTQFHDEATEKAATARALLQEQKAKLLAAEKRREEDAAAKAKAEEEARQTAEEAQRQAEQDAADAAARAAAEAASAASNTADESADVNTASGSGRGGSAGVDTYTGCRAYNGNYAMTNIDKNGKAYAKIDCTTKVQIG